MCRPLRSGLELVSGPRWRLKANKFGQDIPGLEIPLIECSAPPFARVKFRWTSPAQRTEVLWTATVTVDGLIVSQAQGMTLVRDKG